MRHPLYMEVMLLKHFMGASALSYIFISDVKFTLTLPFYSTLSEAMEWPSLGTLFKV